MDGVVDFENVQIGKWQSSIPSEICISKEVFNEIFSTETWYKVLMPDQRERISQFLPPSVLETVGASQQTIEDLLARTLTRFDSNPLDTFYNQLEQGRYDPNVVQTRKALQKAWRKEAIRRRKKYHAKLLQDILVSREKLLEEKRNRRSMCSSAASLASFATKKQSTRLVDLETDEDSVAQNLDKMVEKRYREELSAINREVGCESSSDDDAPPPKKSAKTTKKAAPKSKPKGKRAPPMASSTPVANSVLKAVLNEPALSDISPCPHGITVMNPMNVKLTSTVASATVASPSPVVVARSRDEQTAVQMSKFTKILPAPTTSAPPISSAVITTATNVLPGLNSSIVTVNARHPTTMASPSPSNTSMSNSTPSGASSTIGSLQFQPSPVVKSSPILASHLQSVNALAAASGSQNALSQQNSKLPFAFPSIQNIKMEGNSTDDDLESSSDDEFEAIEPTIGFGTIPATTCSIKQTQVKLTGQKLVPTTITNPMVNRVPQPVMAKVADPMSTPSKPKAAQFIRLTPQNLISASGQQTFSGVKYSTVQLNKVIAPQQTPQTQQIMQQTQTQQTPVQFNQTQTVMQNKINVVKLVTQPGTNTGTIFRNLTTKPIIPVITNSSAVNPCNLPPNPVAQMNIVQTSPSIRAPRPSPAVAVPSNSKILPITVNLQPITKPVVRPVISVPTATHATQNSNIGLNGPSTNMINVSINNQNVLSNILSANNSSTNCVSSNSSGLQMFNLLGSRSVVDPLGEDLNLNLGLGLRMSGLDDSGVTDDDIASLDATKFSKLPDIEKIDDLSVLEGNPFDSIPNLSDELDGLDLDLVDGLCDFEGLLSEEKQYASFFSLIRDVLCSTRDHRMTLVCLEKTIRKWSTNATAALNLWFHRVNDWNEALITALNFLAGNYQDVHPEDFVPYIEYKYKTKYYQWIGAGRDSDNNLTTLCNIWLENADRLPPLKKLDNENEDQEEEEDDENEDSDTTGEDSKKKSKRPVTPPPPRCVTDWSVRPSSQEEKIDFQAQERLRFENPHKAFTYKMHGYESVVGPVKGVYSSQSGMTNKARGHSLLVDDRPPYVTILALVRDAVARLPNGEGTRSEICEMLRDSAFLAPEASNVTLNSVVSGALDRLHYERDPCVRYDSHKKSWVYLHRDRTQEQFERLHHNRSYTKSTKSRSNASRKSRKQGSKTPSTTSKDSKDAVTSPSPATTPVPSIVSTAAPAISQVTQATTKLPPVGSIIAKTSLAPTSTQGILSLGSSMRLSTPQDNLQDIKPMISSVAKSVVLPVAPTANVDGNKQVFSIQQSNPDNSRPQTINVGNHIGDKGPVQLQQIRKIQFGDVFATSPGLGSAIRFTTVPNSTGTVTLGNSTTSSLPGMDSPTSSLIFRTSGNVVSSSTASNPILSPHVGQTTATMSPQTVAVQVQSVATSTGIASFSVNQAKPMVSQSHLQHPVTTTHASLGSNQLLLNPSTLIRLASSIRLPEGVRFAQVRLPLQQGSSQQVGAGQVRLPQQRIILTRAALSSQAQTQGVLLGQTASGQTVILSTTPGALGHLQSGSSQIPISITTSQASHFDTTNLGAQNSSVSNAIVSSMNSMPRTGTISVMSTPVSGGQHQGNCNTHASLGDMSGTHSLVVNSANLIPSSGASTMMPISQNQNVLPTSSSHHIMAHVANQLQQQNSQSGHPNASQLSSPIIIRSQQGDLLIPHLPLGRGMQGIKVIPIPGGKQTVLARIVAPTTQHSTQLASQNPATHTTQ